MPNNSIGIILSHIPVTSTPLVYDRDVYPSFVGRISNNRHASFKGEIDMLQHEFRFSIHLRVKKYTYWNFSQNNSTI